MGSASFVSANGLILTNHHVAAECVQSLSDAKHDFLNHGYGLDRPAPDVACPGMEAQTLVGMDNVTDKVLAAIPAGATDADAAAARRAALAKLEDECKAKTGLQCESVTLYGGAQFWIYSYKVYRDVRLVFAPEMQLAFYGGDADNFNFPRFDLDFAFLRAYDDKGKPARQAQFLTPKLNGNHDGDLLLVSGHPAYSQRFFTMGQLEFYRDYSYPFRLAHLRRVEQTLQDFSKRNEESARRAKDYLFYVQNSIKAYAGNITGLKRDSLMAIKKKEEDALRRRVAADPKQAKIAGGAWDQIARAQEAYRAYYRQHRMLERVSGSLLDYANKIVRLAAELPRPNGERLEEYQDSALEALRHELYAKTPVYPDLEEALLANYLAELREVFGANDPMIAKVLNGKTPAEVAREVATQSKLVSADERKKLAEGGAAAAAASNDPAIRLAAAMDPTYRDLRKRYEEQVKIVEERANQAIAQARFAVVGAAGYPDATFTLRLSYGKVAGYEHAGYLLPWRTTLYGLYERSFAFGNQPPFDLPARWLAARKTLELSTTDNVVTTGETFGGNSGSPVVDRDGKLVGLIFDGNLEGLEVEFIYDDVKARSIHVTVDAIVEALRKVYHRNDLVKEFLGK
jgi:hypothetical protein